jgi:hypothetical protein
MIFLNLLRSPDILRIAESWEGLEIYKVSGYTIYFKGRCKTAKYGRNARGLAVYMKNDFGKCVKEILAIMKEILWLGMREENGLHPEMCIGFIYNALPNLCLYNPNFTRELERN